jgi:hypothetical protein
MYFFTIFVFDHALVVIRKTDMTQAALQRRLEETDPRQVCEESLTRDFWIEYAEDKRFDAWEWHTNGKLYLSESMAWGVAMKALKKMKKRTKNQNRALNSKKKRVRKKYNI